MKMIYHVPEPVFWLWLSGVVFLIMGILLIVGPYRKERTDLMNAFLGFLLGMGVFHILGGAAMLYMVPALMYIASIAAITGSAFVLKFPLNSIVNEEKRNTLFYVALLIGWGLIGYLLLNNATMDLVMNAAAIYMIVSSGLISGFYMIAHGFRINDPATKIKCIGGGCSIVFCCFVTHIIVLLAGLTIFAKVFMVLTPITLALSVVLARRFVRGA